MNARLARMLYFAAQRWRGEPVGAVLRALERSQRWSRERLLALQWERQQALFRHAFETVPWYRERWSALGLTSGSLRTPADWTRIPALTRPDLQAHGAAMRSVRGPRGLTAATSGSSGTPVAVYRSHLSWAHAHANVFRGWRWHGVDAGDPYAYFWGVPLDPEGRGLAARKDRFFNRVHCSAFNLSAEAARASYQRLRARPVRFAFGYPSALAHFADEVTAQDLDGRALGWRVAITSAEALRPHQRERIATAFGCPVVDSYGCAEAGVAGFECEQLGMHVPVESVMVESVPVEGDLHEVLLTDLHNLSQPLLRYRVGDLVEPVQDGAACPCGRGLPLLGQLTGRAGDTIELPDGRRVNANQPSYVFKKHGRSGAVREYQFVRFAGRVELRVTAGPAWSEATAGEIRAEVARVLGIAVEVRVVPRFERRGRGKHRDFVTAEEIGE